MNKTTQINRLLVRGSSEINTIMTVLGKISCEGLGIHLACPAPSSEDTSSNILTYDIEPKVSSCV